MSNKSYALVKLNKEQFDMVRLLTDNLIKNNMQGLIMIHNKPPEKRAKWETSIRRAVKENDTYKGIHIALDNGKTNGL